VATLCGARWAGLEPEFVFPARAVTGVGGCCWGVSPAGP